MIYITGDTHSYFDRFTMQNFPEQKEMTKKDIVIILGDFGGVWCRKENQKAMKTESHILDELDKRSFTTIFIPGNHENYERLMSNEFPEKEWHGGRVKEIRPSIFMLMRGEMFELEGKKFFAFGGASSHDIQDGILDYEDPLWRKKARRMDANGKYMYRVKGLSWWAEELPSPEEKTHAIHVLDKNNWQCDYVLTHESPASDVILLGQGFYKPDDFSKWLEEIRCKLNYKHWFCGHYHENKNINMTDHLLYEQIIRIL